MRILTWLGIAFLGLTGTTFGMVKFQENYGLFFPSGYAESRLRQLPPSLEYREFTSTDGTKLTGLLKKGKSDKPLVVFAHGNAGHMILRQYWFKSALPEDWSGFMLDYRGYGQSEGSPTVPGVKKDVRAAIEYAFGETKSDTLFLHGRSLGVPITAYASQYFDVEGIILESGFPGVKEVAKTILPIPGVGYFISIRMETVDYLTKAQEKHGPFPKLIVHGLDDNILPADLGKELYRRSSEPKEKWWVEGAGHNDLVSVASKRYRDKITTFLKGAAN